jgi:hypothetical protein
MKKLIAILAVFAIMVPALFAQDAGTWSISGAAEIGTTLTFSAYELRDVDQENSEQAVVLVGANPYNSWDGVAGTFNLDYRKGSISTRIGFNQNGRIGAQVEYNDGKYGFKANSKLNDLLGAFTFGNFSADFSAPDPEDWSFAYNRNFWSTYVLYSFDDLFGWYKFFDGMIHLEAAVRHSGYQDGLWKAADLISGDTYTLLDGANYLRLNVNPIDGLDLGFILPGIFESGFWSGGSAGAGNGTGIHLRDPAGKVTGNWNYAKATPRRLLEGSIERMTFGIKYGTGPIAVALQYGLRGRPEELTTADSVFLRNVIYAGFTLGINDQMSVGLDLRGDFFKSFDNGTSLNRDGDAGPGAIAPDTIDRDAAGARSEFENVNRMDLRFGGRFQFTANPLQLRLDVIYFNDINTGVEGGVVRFRPYFRYDVVSTHLRFELDSWVDLPLSEWMLTRYDSYTTVYKDDYASQDDLRGPGGPRAYALGYNVQPMLTFNFLGTGAGGWAPGTGIGIRYNLGGRMYTGQLFNKHSNDPTTNNLQVVFKWSF